MMSVRGGCVVAFVVLLTQAGCSDDPAPVDDTPLPPEPQIGANLAFVTFPLTVEGGTAIADVVLTNTGQKSLEVQAPSITVGPSGVFTLPGNVALSIASRASASIRVQFAPATRGVFFGELTINSNAENAGQVVLQLFGPARSSSAGLDTPDIGLAESSVAIDVEAGQSSALGFVRVFNIGRRSLFLRDYELTDNASGFFALDPELVTPGDACSVTVACDDGLFCDDGSCALSVPSGRFIVINVRYAPTSAGANNATLRISSNDPDQPVVTVPLNGT